MFVFLSMLRCSVRLNIALLLPYSSFRRAMKSYIYIGKWRCRTENKFEKHLMCSIFYSRIADCLELKFPRGERDTCCINKKYIYIGTRDKDVVLARARDLCFALRNSAFFIVAYKTRERRRKEFLVYIAETLRIIVHPPASIRLYAISLLKHTFFSYLSIYERFFLLVYTLCV